MQAFDQSVGDIKGTPTFVQLDSAGTYSLTEKMRFNLPMTAAIAIDGILTHKDTCNIVFPQACVKIAVNPTCQNVAVVGARVAIRQALVVKASHVCKSTFGSCQVDRARFMQE